MSTLTRGVLFLAVLATLVLSLNAAQPPAQLLVTPTFNANNHTLKVELKNSARDPIVAYALEVTDAVNGSYVSMVDMVYGLVYPSDPELQTTLRKDWIMPNQAQTQIQRIDPKSSFAEARIVAVVYANRKAEGDEKYIKMIFDGRARQADDQQITMLFMQHPDLKTKREEIKRALVLQAQRAK